MSNATAPQSTPVEPTIAELQAELEQMRKDVDAEYWNLVRAENTRLRGELSGLRGELADLRAELSANRAPGYCGWAIVELMGHRRYAGRVTPVRQYGAEQMQLDVPIDEDGFRTHFYGGTSVYGVHPCDESIARAVAANNRPTPVHPYEMPRPQLGAGDDGDHLDEIEAQLETEDEDYDAHDYRRSHEGEEADDDEFYGTCHECGLVHSPHDECPELSTNCGDPELEAIAEAADDILDEVADEVRAEQLEAAEPQHAAGDPADPYADEPF